MSLKKATDYLGNDLQVDSALKDGKGQVIHKTYIKKTIPDGTIAKNIGVDSNGDIVKETPASGGGTQLYKHDLMTNGMYVMLINDVPTPYTSITNNTINNSYVAKCQSIATGSLAVILETSNELDENTFEFHYYLYALDGGTIQKKEYSLTVTLDTVTPL